MSNKVNALNQLRTYLSNEKSSLEDFDQLLQNKYATSLKAWLNELEADGYLHITVNLASLVLLDSIYVAHISQDQF